MIKKPGLWLLTKGKKDGRGILSITRYSWLKDWQFPAVYAEMSIIGCGSLLGMTMCYVAKPSFLNVYWALVYTALGMGILLEVGLTCVVLRQRQHLQKLKQIDQASSELGIDEATLRRFATESGIDPRVNINGQDFYDIADFGDAGTLLRPSNPPEALLRPAGSKETPVEQLLHPTHE